MFQPRTLPTTAGAASACSQLHYYFLRYRLWIHGAASKISGVLLSCACALPMFLPLSTILQCQDAVDFGTAV